MVASRAAALWLSLFVSVLVPIAVVSARDCNSANDESARRQQHIARSLAGRVWIQQSAATRRRVSEWVRAAHAHEHTPEFQAVALCVSISSRSQRSGCR